MKLLMQIIAITTVLSCGDSSIQRKEKVRPPQSSATGDFVSVKVQEEPTTAVKPKPMEKLLKLKWKEVIEVSDKENSVSYTMPLAKNGIVFPGSLATHAFDAESGKKLYYSEFDDQEFIRERIEDSLLVYSLDEEAIVLDIYSGTVLNKHRQKSYPRYPISPQLLDKGVFPIVNMDKLELRDILSGELVDTYNSPSEIDGNFLTANDYILFSNEAGVYFMDYTGNLIDSIMVGKIDSKPIISDEIIYFFIEDYGLLAVNYNTRKILWDQKNEWFDANFAIHSDTLFVNHGCLTAIDKKSGEILWEMNQNEEACAYRYNQLVYCNGYLLGLIGGYSSIDVVGAVSSKHGHLEYLYWKDGNIFSIEGLGEPTPNHPEDEGVISLGPEFIFSEVYQNMIFAQYDNLLVAFEILE